MCAAPLHTLDQLAVLESVARLGSFAAAARELHRVPSAVSYAARALEEQLGLTLFDRAGHSVTLTAAGRSVLDEARAALNRARRLEQLAASLREGWEPELQVVIEGVYPMKLITAVLRAFGERQVPTKVRVDVEYQDGVPERFEADHADIMVLLDWPGDDRLAATPLPPLGMVLVAAPDHPLGRARGVDRRALLEHTDLVVRDSSAQYTRAPRKPYMGSQHVIYLSDFYSKRLALLGGVGFGWLPEHLVEDDLRDGALVAVDFIEGNRWTYHPSLITRRDNPPGRAGSLFVELLLNIVHQKS
ncbi:LysR family transcriptional regulator [Myxococcota bacterium]|nr:LysR family transcriptional regulator [Myxococcota bacterium]